MFSISALYILNVEFNQICLKVPCYKSRHKFQAILELRVQVRDPELNYINNQVLLVARLVCMSVIFYYLKNNLCSSLIIKVSSYQVSMKSVKLFSRDSVTFRQVELH